MAHVFGTVNAQSRLDLLQAKVSVSLKNARVETILNQVGQQHDFHFSYGSSIPKDSLATVDVRNAPVSELVRQLFDGKAECFESGRYVVLRMATRHFALEPEEISAGKGEYLITGYVVDKGNGEKIANASVYERQLLQSTLSNAEGYFRLRFKGSYSSVVLTVSKENYRDTSLFFLSGIELRPEGRPTVHQLISRSAFRNLDRGFGRFLVSSKQRIQGLNIGGFLMTRPYQASFVPGLSSHGMMSSQVVNKFSLNVLGGYTAGVDGIEIGGLFNLNKGDVKGLQVGGLINLAGGALSGVQVAGTVNTILDSLKGVEISGILNNVKNNARGTQVAGISNLVLGSVTGVQIAGIVNTSRNHFKGVQIAGISNVALKKMNGLQIGLANFAAKMNGVQIGLVNVSDTSSGYSIGLLNLVKKGYHQLSLSANELLPMNASIRTGNANLYTLFTVGTGGPPSARRYAAGLGFGHDVLFGHRFAFSQEISAQGIYLGDWESTNILSRVQTMARFTIVKGIAIFAGPGYSMYYCNSGNDAAALILRSRYPHRFSPTTRGGISWTGGLTFF